MYDIILHIKSWIEIFISSYAIYFAFTALAVIITKWLSLHKQDITYAKMTLDLVYIILIALLGDRADSIFQIWLQGLIKAENGTFSDIDMINEFIEFIKARSSEKGIMLSDDEIAALQPIAQKTLGLTMKTHVTNTVVKCMIKQ